MGLPKVFKTGAVVGSYPKPLLYLQFDKDGISVVPSKNAPATNGLFQMDTTAEEVYIAKPVEVASWLTKPMSEQPKILAIDFTISSVTDISTDFKPAAFTKPFNDFLAAYNHISAWIRAPKELPWRTCVFDSVTGYEDLILSYMSSVNPNAMTNAKQWAGMCGWKVRQTLLSLIGWPCHVVTIMHSSPPEKNEDTSVLMETPSVFSKGLRNGIGGIFSQFFYQLKENNIPKIWPHPKMYVRGVGARWPANLPTEVAPDFNSIYGKEL